jgi:hypothetical protein
MCQKVLAADHSNYWLKHTMAIFQRSKRLVLLGQCINRSGEKFDSSNQAIAEAD